MNPPKWDHNALAEDLAAHLRGQTDKMVWTNLPLGTVHSSRPDVVTLDRSYRVRLVAFEIKVSLSDFRRDVAEGKWNAYADVANAVYFAVPQGLVSAKDIPAGAGLYIRSESGWKAVRKAPPSPKPTLTSDVWMKLLMDGVDRERDRAIGHKDRIRWLDQYKQAELARKAGGEDLAQALRNSAGFKNAVQEKQVWVQEQLELLDDRFKAALKDHQVSLARLRADRDGLLAEMAHNLGLPPTADLYACSFAIRNIRQRLTENGEVAHLRRVLAAVEKALRDTNLPIDSVPLTQEPA